MIEHSLDTAHSILYVRHSPPSGRKPSSSRENGRPLTSKQLAIGPVSSSRSESFPGWDSLKAMAAHFRFVRDITGASGTVMDHRRARGLAVGHGGARSAASRA